MLPADPGCAFAQSWHDPVKQEHHEPLRIVVGEKPKLPSKLFCRQSGIGMRQFQCKPAPVLFTPGSKSVKKRRQPAKVVADIGRLTPQHAQGGNQHQLSIARYVRLVDPVFGDDCRMAIDSMSLGYAQIEFIVFRYAKPGIESSRFLENTAAKDHGRHHLDEIAPQERLIVKRRWAILA